VQLKSFKAATSGSPATQQWVRGQLSNFEYLMAVNVLSGRTFNNPSQYPLFPWILSGFDGDALDLDEMKSFRDLSRPMGALDDARLPYLLERKESLDGVFYTSGPISPLVVCGYLIRLEPFTSGHIEYQSGRFDYAARLFVSLSQLLQSTTEGPDYRELTPEFFFCPEFLENLSRFNLGVLGDKPINDVLLPKWAKNAIEFVYLHRKALESRYVTESLHLWINLMFGIDQDNADKYHIYSPALYSTVWKQDHISADDERDIKTSLEMLGQIPHRIFREPHPKRVFAVERLSGELITTAQIATESQLEYVCVCDASGSRLSMIGGCRNGTWVCFTVDVGNGSVSGFTMKKYQPGVTCNGFPDCLILKTTTNKFVHLRQILGQPREIRTDAVPSVVSVAAHGEWFSISDGDFVTWIYNDFRSTPVFKFRSYRGPIICAAISETWKIHVLATADGGLGIASLSTGEPVRVISLGATKPVAVMVTEAWGFIVVYGIEIVHGVTSYHLVVHTVNGAFVRKSTIGGEPSAFTAFSSCRAFDYFAYVLRKQLYVCEVFFLIPRIVAEWQLAADARQLIYNKEHARFVIFDEARQMHLVPYAPDDFENV
jgi:hypothetical protein